GQSKIDILLFEGTTYFFVTSQWDRFSAAQPFTLTITGPALIEDVTEPVCPGDATGDGVVDLADLNLVLANFGTETDQGDVTGDGFVDLADLNLVLANFGTEC
ncbi:MAG: GC-type dockerin domain-anchored protein, partial [Phycisphaerales bacterium]